MLDQFNVRLLLLHKLETLSLSLTLLCFKNSRIQSKDLASTVVCSLAGVLLLLIAQSVAVHYSHFVSPSIADSEKAHYSRTRWHIFIKVCICMHVTSNGNGLIQLRVRESNGQI